MQNCIALRKKIIETAYKAKEGHIASALSILDIIYVLYDKILTQNKDKFILSKGHGCLALYVVLENKGFFSEKELLNYCEFNSNLGGHPYPKLRGIEAATGSLGHGLPFSIGIALGLKLKGLKARVITMVGDQECNEGTIWESILLADHHKLHNLTIIVDNNNSSKRSLPMKQLEFKFKSFGLNVVTINGHDHEQIEHALRLQHSDVPSVIVANTIKGHGCKIMEDDPNEWHHKIPTAEEYKQLIEE